MFTILISLLSYFPTASPSISFAKNYNPTLQVEKLEKEIDFWKLKLDNSPNQYIYILPLASSYSKRFDLISNIEDLKTAEKLLTQGVDMAPDIHKSGLLRSLSQNLITQHKFCDALDHILHAEEIGGNKRATDLILFDLYHELGNEQQESTVFKRISEIKDFQYLIRRAKLEDSNGNLSDAILYMEMAKKTAFKVKNKSQLEWVNTNIGDYYGHAGKIDIAEYHYLKTLESSPHNWYALKGLAWIAYSHENNISKSLLILNKIAKHNNSPDIISMRAEIAKYQGQDKYAIILEKEYISKVSEAPFGNMYTKYLINLSLTQEFYNLPLAKSLAAHEVVERPTSLSYALQSAVFHHQNDTTTAKSLARKNVLGKSTEPDVLMLLLEIFQDEKSIVESLQSDLKDARFELGPIKYARAMQY